MRDYEAFALTSCQSAIARHGSEKDAPYVQIVSVGPGVSINGVEALEELRKAIDFAMGEEKER